jgi:MbtH protein
VRVSNLRRSLLGWDFPSIEEQSVTERNLNNREADTGYKVVVNHEEQYSIWRESEDAPLGWREVGRSGTKEECLNFISGTWTDLRPLSLRKKMEKGGQ